MIQITSSDGSIITEQLDSCTWDLTIQVDTDNNLVYGGVVTWLQDYDFHVSPAGYFINGIFYESPEAFITLAPADPTLDRFDVIYVDADQIVKVAEGEPSITASQPGLDLGLELGLGVIFVEAASTQPGTATEECAYIDNGEWTSSASDGSIVVASTNTPCSGSVSIEGTTVTSGDYFKLTRATSFALSPDFNNFHFTIRSKGAWGNRKLNIRWYNAGLPVGSPVVFGHNTYSFASNNTVDCQFIAIDAADFGMPISQVVDEIRFTMSGTSNIGFYIDNICIQNNGSILLPGDNDIHNQRFGPQTPGDFWILGDGKAEGWFTSPQRIGTSDAFYNVSEKFGIGSIAEGAGSTAIGALARTYGVWDMAGGSTAVGCQAEANEGSVALGYYSRAGYHATAVSGSAMGNGSVAIGPGASSSANSAITLGGGATASGVGSISIGYYTTTGGGYGGIALGSSASVPHNHSLAFGTFAASTGDRQVIFGADHPVWGDFGFNSLYFGRGVTAFSRDNKFWTITGSQGTDVYGDDWYIAGAKATGDAFGGAIYLQTADKGASGTTLQSLSTKVGLNSNTLGFYMDNTRFQMDEGASIVGAPDLTLGTGNTFTVTGNVGINAIVNLNWQDGAIIYLLFTGTPTIQHNVTGGVDTSPIRLAGSLDFSVTNNTVLALLYKDGYWREVGRTQASALGPYTFLNGIHEDFGGLVKLGGTLIENTNITQNNKVLRFMNGGGRVFSSDPVNQAYQFGDIDSVMSGAAITIDDAQERFVFQTDSGRFLDVNQSTATYSIGDIDIGLNGSYLAIDDFNLTWTATNIPTGTTSNILYYDSVTGALTYGATSGVFPGITADNGLTANTATNVQLGGTGIQNTNINWSNFTFTNTWNTLSGSGLILSSSSTAAASNLQKLLSASLSGANSNAGQTSSAIYGVNTHSGSVNTNQGIMGEASGGTLNRGVYGLAGSGTNSYGVHGESTSTTGVGVVGQASGSSTARGVVGTSDGSGLALGGESNLSSLIVGRGLGLTAYNSAGAGGTGLGSSIEWTLETTTGNRSAGTITNYWSDGTDASRTSRYVFSGVNNAVTADLLTIKGTGQLQGNKYGVGSFTAGTAAYIIATDASGNFFEYPAGGIGGGGGGLLISADNGLSVTSGTNVQLFGTLATPATLLDDRYLSAAGFLTTINSTNANTSFYAVNITNSAAGGSLGVSNNGGGSASTMANGGIGDVLTLNATSGRGLVSNSTSGISARFVVNPSSTNSIVEAIRIYRSTSGTAADGIGGNISFYTESATGTERLSNEIISKWTTAADATRTSQLDITAVNSTATGTIASFYGTGVVGIGISSGYTPSRLEVVDNSFAGGSMARFSSTSTAATGDNLNRTVEIIKSGTQVNAVNSSALYISQTTVPGFGSYAYGIYSYANIASGSGNSCAVRADVLNQVGMWATATTGTAILAQSSATGYTIGAFNTSSGPAVQGQNTAGTGYGVHGISTNNIGVYGQGNSTYGVQGTTVSAAAGNFVRLGAASAGDASVLSVLRLERTNTSNTVGNGVGGSIEYYLEASDGASYLSNEVISRFTDVTVGTRTSQLDITGINSTSTQTIMSAYGTGVVGIGISSAYTATRLNVVDNTVGGANIVNITSTSTAASGNLQKGLNVELSGTNATAGQFTYGIYGSNAHAGSGSINYGVYGISANGASVNVGVNGFATGTSAVGVGGNGTGWGGQFQSSGVGVQGISSGGYAGVFTGNINSATGVSPTVFIERSYSGGVPTDGIGTSTIYAIETTNGTNEQAATVEAIWTTVNHATRTSQVKITGVLSGTSPVDLATFHSDGSWNIRPITATAASAITPSEGKFVFVSDTNGTFTTVGIWCYQNGAWKAL